MEEKEYLVKLRKNDINIMSDALHEYKKKYEALDYDYFITDVLLKIKETMVKIDKYKD